MKVVKPSYEIYEKPEANDRMGVLKFIEKIGRTCYKSEDKITDESCVKFVNMLRKNMHLAMLEHYIFTLRITNSMMHDINEAIDLIRREDPVNKLYKDTDNEPDEFDQFADQRFSEVLNHFKITPYYFTTTNKIDGDQQLVQSDAYYLISFSATTLLYLAKYYNKYERDNVFNYICEYMSTKIPELFLTDEFVPTAPDEFDISNESRIHIMSNKELQEQPADIRAVHDMITVKFVTDRGVTHEIVRHRPFSYAQESTRYCNYHKEDYEFGINVITPINILITRATELTNLGLEYQHGEERAWYNAMYECEKAYNEMVGLGVKPQTARSVLPTCLKTEIIMTGRMVDFIHFFRMRADKAAHPDLRLLAVPFLNECIEKYPEIYKLLQHRVEENKEWIDHYERFCE